MKLEDIDKKIGMPDVDAEWAKFEREVITPETRISATRTKRSMIWKIAATVSIILCVSGGIIAAVYEQKQREYKEVQVDESVDTKPLVTFSKAFGRRKLPTYFVNLCPGTWVQNSIGENYLEEIYQGYSFFAPKGGVLVMQINGQNFDHDNLPEFTNKDLSKIETHLVNSVYTVNLITGKVMVPTDVRGNVPTVYTIGLRGNNSLEITTCKATPGDWIHYSVTSWEPTPWGTSIRTELELASHKPELKVYIYASTDATQGEIDRAIGILQDMGIQNYEVTKDIPIVHWTDQQYRDWARHQKEMHPTYDWRYLFDALAPEGVGDDLSKKWHIVKEVYGVMK